MRLPIYQDPNQNLMLLQSNWSGSLNTFLSNPYLNGIILDGVSLASGTTVINHRLGRQMQGWVVVDVSAAATIYRSKPMNAQTLTLVSSAACIVSLYIF